MTSSVGMLVFSGEGFEWRCQSSPRGGCHGDTWSLIQLDGVSVRLCPAPCGRAVQPNSLQSRVDGTVHPLGQSP